MACAAARVTAYMHFVGSMDAPAICPVQQNLVPALGSHGRRWACPAACRQPLLLLNAHADPAAAEPCMQGWQRARACTQHALQGVSVVYELSTCSSEAGTWSSSSSLGGHTTSFMFPAGSQKRFTRTCSTP